MARPAVPTLPSLPVRRLLRRARRSPAAWWAAAAALALFVATQVAALDDDAAARRQAWGDAVQVVVAARPLSAGDVVGPGDMTVQQWPAAMLPDGALAEVPAGRTVVAQIVAGEAVVADRVAPTGLRGVAALIPEGHRAIAVPSSSGGFGTDVPAFAVGDRVDVLATFDVIDVDDLEASRSEPTGIVARDALVVDVTETAVTVAVLEHDTTRVAFAVARGTVTLALIGAG